MDFETLYEEHLETILDDILSEREQFNATYATSSVTVEGKRLIIRWFNHRSFDDPEGKEHFSERVIPFNFTHVMDEISRQWNKLSRGE